jgi:ElaB/YqjD/DUF883 family membrane-anchored ribosome-binding protein
MAYDPKKTAAARKGIDATQEHECRYWSGQFGISPDELKQAVMVAGPMVEDVARYLGRSPLATATPGQTGIAERAQRVADDARDFAKETAQDVRQAAEQATDHVMKFIAARPVASVLIGAAAGYVLGWVAAGAVRHSVAQRRAIARVRRLPLEHERLVQVREWPRTTRSRARLDH